MSRRGLFQHKVSLRATPQVPRPRIWHVPGLVVWGRSCDWLICPTSTSTARVPCRSAACGYSLLVVYTTLRLPTASNKRSRNCNLLHGAGRVRTVRNQSTTLSHRAKSTCVRFASVVIRVWLLLRFYLNRSSLLPRTTAQKHKKETWHKAGQQPLLPKPNGKRNIIVKETETSD
jgi:hypothetical protein